MNVPVKLQSDEQDITINPNDYLIADNNGVVVLPRDLAGEVLPIMERGAKADEQVAAAVGEGMPFAEASKKFRYG